MGKNDLWIAATTSVFNGTLLTTDGDFHHLHNTFFPVAYINPELYWGGNGSKKTVFL